MKLLLPVAVILAMFVAADVLLNGGGNLRALNHEVLAAGKALARQVDKILE